MFSKFFYLLQLIAWIRTCLWSFISQNLARFKCGEIDYLKCRIFIFQLLLNVEKFQLVSTAILKAGAVLGEEVMVVQRMKSSNLVNGSPF